MRVLGYVATGQNRMGDKPGWIISVLDGGVCRQRVCSYAYCHGICHLLDGLSAEKPLWISFDCQLGRLITDWS